MPHPPPIRGIHHITAIASDPQANHDFYAKTLGLRLVKKTVNFDDPGTYHLYYGDETGRPGTIMTFFPCPMARRGIQGAGQATVTSFSVPQGSLGYWTERLEKLGVPFEDPRPRFGEEVLTMLDPDGLKLELVARANINGDNGGDNRDNRGDDGGHEVRGFDGVTLTEWNPEVTAEVLMGTLGFRPAGQQGDRFRFEAGASRVDMVAAPASVRGHISAGTVHHVAWRAADDADQVAWREAVAESGLHVTPVLDRQYFRSIYFREPGGVLFEIATDPPGFTRDEPVESLGSSLKLPPWLEPERKRIEQALPPIEVHELVKAGGVA